MATAATAATTAATAEDINTTMAAIDRSCLLRHLPTNTNHYMNQPMKYLVLLSALIAALGLASCVATPAAPPAGCTT